MRISDWSSDVCSSDLFIYSPSSNHEESRAHVGICYYPDDHERRMVVLFDLSDVEQISDQEAAIKKMKTRMKMYNGYILNLRFLMRSEERGVGTEWVSKCKFRWWALTKKKNKKI